MYANSTEDVTGVSVAVHTVITLISQRELQQVLMIKTFYRAQWLPDGVKSFSTAQDSIFFCEPAGR